MIIWLQPGLLHESLSLKLTATFKWMLLFYINTTMTTNISGELGIQEHDDNDEHSRRGR